MTRPRPNRRKAPKRELPKLPGLRINWRVLVTLACSASILAAAFLSGRQLLEFPLRHIEHEGRFQRVSQLEVEAAVRPLRGQDLLTLDFTELRDRIREIDWVDRVRLQRVWPDTIRISITEHVAAAKWGESALLNTRGELFAEDSEREYPQLPRLAGPPGSLDRVADRYLQIRERLAGTGLNLTAVRMDARGSFTAEFGGALSVRIGREDVDGRIDRFFRIALPELADELAGVDYVDMRYSNGFAVGWYEPESSRLARVANSG